MKAPRGVFRRVVVPHAFREVLSPLTDSVVSRLENAS